MNFSAVSNTVSPHPASAQPGRTAAPGSDPDRREGTGGGVAALSSGGSYSATRDALQTDTGPPLTYAIEAIGLTKRFGGVAAVDDLTLRVPCGSTVGFIGPNGAGKSTTIRMLLGMLRPSSGTARVLGIDACHRCEEIKERVGYVPEMHFIYRWMRVGEVVAFCRGLYRTWNDETCRSLLELFCLDERKRVRQLSKGMMVKLALLVAIAHEPEVLILDEPTSGLDPLIREEFLDGVLRTICDRQRSVLFSSHTLSDVQRLADSVAIIYEGRLMLHRATDELLTGTKRIRAVLTDRAAPPNAPTGTICQRHEGREWVITVSGYKPQLLDELREACCFEHVDVEDLGLEEVFKDLVRGRRMSTC